MIDWDTLIQADGVGVPLQGRDVPALTDKGQELGQSVPVVPAKTGSVPLGVGQAKASNSKACSHFFASVPVVPLKNQGTGKEPEEIAGAVALPQPFRAEVREKGNAFYEANPAAVLLVLAWSRLKQATRDERAGLLLDLESMPPSDQVKHWHGVCVADGLKPWRVLCCPAPLWGDDCTRCKHLTTREEAIGEDRRRYHWACSLGYLILEHGRGTERVQISPPECKSFDRWYPAEWR